MTHISFLSCPPPNALLGHWPFIKMHGLQNHFVILDSRNGPKWFDPDDFVRICDSHTGVGGEQLLTIEHASDEGYKAGAYAAMRIFNTKAGSRRVRQCHSLRSTFTPRGDRRGRGAD